jgi:nucleotide-binding universal stress UspA family protein
MIQKEAETIKADAIVMGTQGTNHSSFDKFIGTVSTSVINDAPCPVVLIPRNYKFIPIEKIVFTTNLNHGDPFELWRAVELIRPQIGVIRCLHVTRDEEKKHDHDLESYAKFLVEHSPTIQTFFDTEVCDDVEKCIVDYTDTHDAQLMVMHKTKKTFWEKLFGVSHTSRMASKLKVPLLIMN